MKPMMQCGHAANSVQHMNDGTDRPACVICAGTHPGSYVIDESAPSLEGRIAYCGYKMSPCNTHRYGNGPKPDYGTYDQTGRAFAPSSPKLPFFEHKPTEQYDSYFCGCMGWD